MTRLLKWKAWGPLCLAMVELRHAEVPARSSDMGALVT